jgi:TolB protein
MPLDESESDSRQQALPPPRARMRFSRGLEGVAVAVVVLLLVGGFFVARTLISSDGTPGPAANGASSHTGEIAFASDQSGPYQIYVVGEDGSNLRQLTFGADDHTGPIWSPDGKSLAYFQTRPFVHGHGMFTGPPDAWPPASIYVMNADGSNQRNLTPTPSREFRNPTWSPDGKQIVVECSRDRNDVGNGQICVLNVDGSGVRHIAPADITMEVPVWSPDGRWIAVLGQRLGSQASGVYLVSPDGSDSRLVSSAADAPVDLAWSPDGSKLEFTQRWWANGAARGKITIMNVNGASRRDLDIGDFVPNGIQWSPNGARLLVVASAPLSSRSEVDVINADGSGLRKIVPEETLVGSAT